MKATRITVPFKILGLLLLSWGLSSCGSSDESEKVFIRPVKAVQAVSPEETQGRDYPGVSQESSEAELSFRVGGPLIQLNVQEGQRVLKGMLLAEIDPRDLNVDLMAKEGRYIQAKAEKERYENLYEKKSISKNELDQKTAVFLEAKSAFNAAENGLNDTKMFAPFNAYVGKKLVENYEEVRPKQTIMTLIDLSVLEIKTHIPEALAVQFSNFSGYSVEFETFPGVIFAADLKELEKKPVPEGYPLTLFLRKPTSGDKNFEIVPGFTCKVNLHLKQDVGDAAKINVVVPLSAIFEGETDAHTSVWIFDKENGLVNKRTVKVQQFVSNNSVLLSEGVEPGEWVVTAGVHRLTEGDQVKALQEKL